MKTHGELVFLLIIAYLLGLLSATAEAQRLIPIDEWIEVGLLGGTETAVAALHGESRDE